MHRQLCSLIVVSALFLSTARTQEGAPPPAAELKALQSLVGNWTGSGKMMEPGGIETPWTAVGTYRWCMDGHFLREDFSITFEGNAQPLVFRTYMGWDGENKHYANLVVSNGGEARLNEMKVLPDGSMLQLMMQDQEGMPYAERALFKVDGDRMTHSIDVMMATGASLTMVDGVFTRGGKGFDGAFGGGTFMGKKPHGELAKVARMVGTYDVQGTMVPAPGAPEMKITGTDSYEMVFAGTVLHAHTDGVAEGMPGKYESDVFWAWDTAHDRLLTVFVDNMGTIGSMDAFFAADGKSLISISAALVMGQPTVQRFVTTLDAGGRPASSVGHSITGATEPAKTFAATYKKK